LSEQWQTKVPPAKLPVPGFTPSLIEGCNEMAMIVSALLVDQ
jgi:hypothetical protein